MTIEYAFPMALTLIATVIIGWYYIIKKLIEHHQNG